jgi:hypothetical protein
MLVSQHIQNPAQDHVWILQNHRSRYFTFQFFKKKLKLKSIYMFWESGSSSYTEHNKIMFAIFGFFCDFMRFFKVAAKTHKRDEIHFVNRLLESFEGSQLYP